MSSDDPVRGEAGAGFFGSTRHFQYRAWIGLVFGVGAAFMPHAAPRGYFVGLACLAAFVAIRVWVTRSMGGAAHVHERKARKKRTLLTEGPFRFCRNPLYVANSLGIAGACWMLAPWWFGVLGLVSSLVWYTGVARWEERLLADLYPDEYPAFMATTHRLLPIPRRKAAASGIEPYPWTKVARRERGVLVGSVALTVLAAWKTGFFG